NGDLTGATISVTASTITVTLSGSTAGAKTDSLTISGIQVQATDGSALPSTGQIYRKTSNAGTATLSGVTTTATTDRSGGTSFHALSQAAGGPKTILFTTAAQTIERTVTSGTMTVELRDQFGNPSTAGATVNLATTSGGGVFRNTGDTATIT